MNPNSGMRWFEVLRLERERERDDEENWKRKVLDFLVFFFIISLIWNYNKNC